MERIAPENPDVLRLIEKMRLISQHDRHQPVRILDRDESACAGGVAGETFHEFEECRVGQRDGERLPTAFRHVATEGLGAPE